MKGNREREKRQFHFDSAIDWIEWKKKRNPFLVFLGVLADQVPHLSLFYFTPTPIEIKKVLD